MAGRLGLDPTEESKSYSALFVLMVALLLAGAVWAIWDDNISRRPWKQYQVEFDQRAYQSFMHDAGEEDARLAKVPAYVKLTKQLDAARQAFSSGETTAKLVDLNTPLTAAKLVADDKHQIVRFTKYKLTQRWYDYNHAIQTDADSKPIKDNIDRLNQRLVGEQATSDAAKAKVDAIKGQIEALNSKVESITEELKKYTKKRDDFIEKADTYMLPITFQGRDRHHLPQDPTKQR